MNFETFSHTAPKFDQEALKRALLCGSIIDTRSKVAALQGCLAALWKNYRQNCGTPDRGTYRPVTRGPAPETIFGVELYDVYVNLGGEFGSRSHGFYSFALECATLCEIEIGARENFKMKMHRAKPTLNRKRTS